LEKRKRKKRKIRARTAHRNKSLLRAEEKERRARKKKLEGGKKKAARARRRLNRRENRDIGIHGKAFSKGTDEPKGGLQCSKCPSTMCRGQKQPGKRHRAKKERGSNRTVPVKWAIHLGLSDTKLKAKSVTERDPSWRRRHL